MAVQGATRADQRGPDASPPPAPDGAVATVAPQERGLEMQPEEKVTRPRARTHARTCGHPRGALADARTDARIDLHSTRTKHTLIRTLSQTRTHADTHVCAYT